MRDIIAWTSGKPLAEGHPLAAIKVTPHTPGAPEVFVLGSSDYGAQVAAYLGVPYCFAAFIGEQGAEQALEIYRRYYQPSERHPLPMASVCIFALAAETPERARFVFATRGLARINRDRGIRNPLLPPQEALDRLRGTPDEAKLNQLADRAIIGDGPQVAAKLRDYARALGVGELTLLTQAHALDDRKRSFELIAKEFALSAA